MLCCSKGLLHRPQLLVAEHSLQRIEIGVGPQHEDAVELVLRLDLFGVDREVLLAERLEIAPKARVADQCLVALGELALQCGHDRSPIGGILLSLLAVAADDVAPPRQHHRLGLVIDLLAALLQHQRYERRWIVEHQLAYQLVRPLAYPQDVQQPPRLRGSTWHKSLILLGAGWHFRKSVVPRSSVI